MKPQSRVGILGPRRTAVRPAPAAICWVTLLLVMGTACVDASEDPVSTRDPSPVIASASVAPVGEAPRNWEEAACSLDPEIVERIARGYFPGRSPDVLYVPREPNQFPNNHSGPWDYLQRVPLVLYGPGFVEAAGSIGAGTEVTVADLAPTYAELLGEPLGGRDGRVLERALRPARSRPSPPRLILTVVWDGGGWSGLEAWPDSWPVLRELARSGTSFADAVVGSSPSITPAVHTTLGTGSFPSSHGIVDILQRHDERMVSSYADKSAAYLEVPTFADVYDVKHGNEPLVGMIAYKAWHLGMIGHGADYAGGDKDIAALIGGTGNLSTNPAHFSLPGYLRDLDGLDAAITATDASDGSRDMRWMGNDVLRSDRDLRDTPVWVRQQTALLEELITHGRFGADEVPDLLFVNYKQIDQVGHRWGVLEPEMRAVIAETDAQLGRIVELLDEEVGKGRWVLAVTADHGPSPNLPARGGWPLHMPVLQDALEERFGTTIDEMFLDQRAQGIWLLPGAESPGRVSAEAVAEFIVDYQIQDDVPPGEDVPDEFEDRLTEPVFSAAFPARRLSWVRRCAADSTG